MTYGREFREFRMIPRRELTDTEHAVLKHLLSAPFPGYLELNAQIKSATAIGEYLDGTGSTDPCTGV